MPVHEEQDLAAPPRARRVLARAAVASVALGLAACATLEPAPLAPAELVSAAEADEAAMKQGVQPIAGPLTLEEAMARALKYNLDRRASMIEEALALNQLESARYDMLPQLLAQAGYNWRNNDLIRQSRNAENGTLSPSQFISQERDNVLSSLGFTWSVLDLGLSYYNSRQQADRVLIALERRRKAMHLLMQDVRTAYWRVAAAQRLREEIARTLTLADEALADARKAESERVREPMESLHYQRRLLEDMRDLESVEQELAAARYELAALINAPLDQSVELAQVEVPGVTEAVLDAPVALLEDTVLAKNADLREAHYNARIARVEVRRTLVRLFPNLSLNWSYKHDTDTFLVNSDWQEAGAQLAMNLFNLLSAPARVRLAETGVELADQRRMVMHLVVLTQMHLARQGLIDARRRYERADAIYAVDARLAEMTAAGYDAQTLGKLDLVSARTSAILSQMNRYQALSQVQSAESRLIANLGLEPSIGSVDELSLQELTEQLRRQSNPWSFLSAR